MWSLTLTVPKESAGASPPSRHPLPTHLEVGQAGEDLEVVADLLGRHAQLLRHRGPEHAILGVEGRRLRGARGLLARHRLEPRLRRGRHLLEVLRRIVRRHGQRARHHGGGAGGDEVLLVGMVR